MLKSRTEILRIINFGSTIKLLVMNKYPYSLFGAGFTDSQAELTAAALNKQNLSLELLLATVIYTSLFDSEQKGGVDHNVSHVSTFLSGCD